MRKLFLFVISLVVASIVWLLSLQFVFPINAKLETEQTTLLMPDIRIGYSLPILGQKLLNAQLKTWADPQKRDIELKRLKESNPEWDFMFRTYFSLSLLNQAIAEPLNKDVYLDIVDAIIEDTLSIEKEFGDRYFHMSYNPWLSLNTPSLFTHGELGLILGLRCMVDDDSKWKNEFKHRVEIIETHMLSSSVLCGESYPDECWIFCNTFSLVAIKVYDRVFDTDHSEFFVKWVNIAKTKLIHEETGLLVSAFHVDGRPHSVGEFPEGSSIWMASHLLEPIDKEFAREQYDLARKELGRIKIGLGYAREWPESIKSGIDIDSGVVVPVVEAGLASSGLALIAASAFEDDLFQEALVRSLMLAGFPEIQGDSIYFRAGNRLGDAVLLYALCQGPAWDMLKETDEEK